MNPIRRFFGRAPGATTASDSACPMDRFEARLEEQAATQRALATWHAEQRQRVLENLTFNRAQISNAPHYNALSHAAGVAAGYLKAAFELGLITRDEAIEQNNAIAIAVNCRSPALMMDVIDTRVFH